MKTCLSIIAVLFFCSESKAQNEYDTLFMLHKVWVNAKEESWSFNNRQVSPYNDYRNFAFYVYDHKIYMKQVYPDHYYDSEEEEVVDCIFRVCKVTNDELVLYPLNAEAISLMDEQRELYAEPRPALYKTYLKELKAAGKDQKKRNLVISTYRTKHNLDADTLKFMPRSSYFEAATIDSVDVSLTWVDQLDDDNIMRTQFNDLRWVTGSGKYYFGYRFRDAKIPPQQRGEGLSFVPPIVMDDDSELPPKQELQLKETAQDSLMRILDEAPAGWYTGKFDPVGMLLLETSLQMYGLNKPHHVGSKEDSYYSVRVYHEGKYTDFYVGTENPSLLQENFLEFVENWTHYVKTFEEYQGKTILFPIARSK